MNLHIPFNKPWFAGSEYDHIRQAIANGHLSGDGPFTKKVSKVLEGLLAVHRLFLTTSCTHALEMAAILLDLEPGDEVIVPSFTFVTSANAFVLHGAKPVFADIRPDTMNIDESKLESLLTPRTRAVVVVHYAGVACEMDDIMRIARKHGLRVIEDNAHGIFARYKSRNLGTIGDLGTLSFHETKNLSCGEGGALMVNDPGFVDRAEIIREKGTDRGRFFRGEVDKYTWVDKGSSFLPSDALAAILLAQIEARDFIQKRRGEIWRNYMDGLEEWAGSIGARLPFVPGHCDQSFHMFYVIMPSLAVRQAFIAHMKAADIHCIFHYVPLHTSIMGKRYGYKVGDCPVTESVSDCLVRLPFFNGMTGEEQERVIERARDFKA